MPRTGKKENLDPIHSKEVARERQLKSAAKKSQNAKERKIFKEEIMKRLKQEDFEKIIDNLIKRAMMNDKSLEVLRDTIGQKPKEIVEAAVTTYEDKLKETSGDDEF